MAVYSSAARTYAAARLQIAKLETQLAKARIQAKLAKKLVEVQARAKQKATQTLQKECRACRYRHEGRAGGPAHDRKNKLCKHYAK